jgi:hypothetical protein
MVIRCPQREGAGVDIHPMDRAGRIPVRRSLVRALRLCLCAVIGVAAGLTVYVRVLHAAPVMQAAPSAIQGDLRDARSSRTGVRTPFIGNSLTYTNAMPATVQRVVKGYPHGVSVFSAQFAVGGAFLAQSIADPRLPRLLHSAPWNWIVLQEDSIGANDPAYLESSTLAAERQIIRWAPRAHPMIFETWGYKNGYFAGDSYQQMQRRIQLGERQLVRALHADVAPVGDVWAQALHDRPGPVSHERTRRADRWLVRRLRRPATSLADGHRERALIDPMRDSVFTPWCFRTGQASCSRLSQERPSGSRTGRRAP